MEAGAAQAGARWAADAAQGCGTARGRCDWAQASQNAFERFISKSIFIGARFLKNPCGAERLVPCTVVQDF